jgi:hypothetical protein
VRDNLETLYGAIDDGAIAVRIPKHARKELEACLDCGLLCRRFARLRCRDCGESLLVAFSCKGRDSLPFVYGTADVRDGRLNPHLHLVVLDGAYHEQGRRSRLAGARPPEDERRGVLERAVRRMERHLRRRGLLVEDDGTDADAESGGDPESNLAARRPPAFGEGIRKRVESLRRSSPRFRVPHRCILKSVERLVATAVSSSSATDETDH